MNRRIFLAGSAAAIAASLTKQTHAQKKILLPIITNGYDPARIGITSDWQTALIFEAIKNRPVDFWCIAGDVNYTSPDLIESDTNWRGTVYQLSLLNTPFYAVPGNHDYNAGSIAPFSPPVAHALPLWQEYIGDTQFAVETDSIKIVGVDYLDWSPENQDWLAGQLQTSKRRVVISHYPLLGCWQYWNVYPSHWDWWDQYYSDKLSFMIAHGVELFVAGHRHQFSITKYQAMTHIICPSVAGIAGSNMPEPIASDFVPFTIPVNGWLEMTSTFVEVFRNDGVSLGIFGW